MVGGGWAVGVWRVVGGRRVGHGWVTRWRVAGGWVGGRELVALMCVKAMRLGVWV